MNKAEKIEQQAPERNVGDLPVVVYSLESPLSKPGQLVAKIFADLYRSRELIWTLFQRDLKAQFRQSFLGYVWLFLPPLMTTAVWVFLNGQKIVAVESPQMPYPLFVIIGTVVWQTFVKLVQSPLQAFNAGKPTFMKLNVAPESFIVAGTARAVFEFLIYGVILIPMLAIYRVAPTWTVVLVPIVMLSLFLLGTAVGLALVPLGSLYADIQKAIPLLMAILMYLAPVVYPPPETGWASVVVSWNPVTPILMGARDLLTGGDASCLISLIPIACISGAVILVSFVVLRVVMPHLVARMGM